MQLGPSNNIRVTHWGHCGRQSKHFMTATTLIVRGEHSYSPPLSLSTIKCNSNCFIAIHTSCTPNFSVYFTLSLSNINDTSFRKICQMFDVIAEWDCWRNVIYTGNVCDGFNVFKWCLDIGLMQQAVAVKTRHSAKSALSRLVTWDCRQIHKYARNGR